MVEPTTPEEQVTNLEEEGTPRPHQDSYFLPGKIGGRNVQCLLDSGCTTNILSKHVFDRLPSTLKDRLEARRTHGALADGTQISFYGLVSLELKLRGDRITEVFVVGRISEDVILGDALPVRQEVYYDIWRAYPEFGWQRVQMYR